jgi:hypothetical protein
MSRIAVLSAALVATLTAGPALAADAPATQWPCQQRKVAEISPGQVWTGPSLQDLAGHWEDDDAIAGLARQVAARRTTVDEAKQLIGQFADARGPDKDAALTTLAGGVLTLINSERGSIIAGIERYARRQKALADKIQQERVELGALPAQGTAEQEARRADLQEMLNWDSRILEERERSLRYVCELPVELERRAFALGRDIASHLDKQ